MTVTRNSDFFLPRIDLLLLLMEGQHVLYEERTGYLCIIIIIIVIIRHELSLIDLFRPLLIVPSKVFQVVLVICSVIQHYFWHPAAARSCFMS